MKFSFKFYLYIIVFLEGYIILSTELLAMRLALPFISNGTEIISIIIASVLMPLSLGCYQGGNFVKNNKYKPLKTIRNKLISNIKYSSIILSIGLSQIFLEFLFKELSNLHYINQGIIFSVLILILPSYWLGQTIPLISNYFNKYSISNSTGVILSFSTVGSFCGSIVSTIFIMPIIGANNVIIINITLLFIMYFILCKDKMSMNTYIMLLILSLTYLLNNNEAIKQMNIIANTNKSTIKVQQDNKGDYILDINNALSAKYSNNINNRFEYIQFIEKQFIYPINKNHKKKSILVLGAGGFTVGIDDDYNNYTFVDIEDALQDVVEKHFLKRQLKSNKKFIAMPARAFLNKNKNKYDLIIIDVFNGKDIPMQLITKEFFIQVKNALNYNSFVLMNIIAPLNFENDYITKLHNTLYKVFNYINNYPMIQNQPFEAWNKNNIRNIIYSYYHKDYNSDIYTDNKNGYFLDN